MSAPNFVITEPRHTTWVKLAHWAGTISFLLLVFSGFEILMVHPRLYWGDVGNDLTHAWLELPVSRNYHHGGWTQAQAFFNTAGSPVSAGRTYDIFNQNGWGRSLHFLSAWILVIVGLCYLIASFITRHMQRHIVPGKKELSFKNIMADIRSHWRMQVAFLKGPQYGPLQKIIYMIVLLVLCPVIVLTGLTMSPAVTAANPWLFAIFGGQQSARSIHFITASLLVIFLLIHVIMIVRSGFKKHMLAMTVAK